MTLVNTGTQTATYRIFFIQMNMTESGQIVEVDENQPAAPFADRLVRFSPRQVTLAPHTPQTVRVQLRKPADLAPGEYRSHLLFRAIPVESSSEPFEAPAPRVGSETRVELVPIYGVAIPVIVRHGETAATAHLSIVSLRAAPASGEPPMLALSIRRDGNQSVYGNLSVTYIDANGDEEIVGRADGVAVYTPTSLRRLDVPLNLKPGVSLNDGRLRVTYAGAEELDELFANAEIKLR